MRQKVVTAEEARLRAVWEALPTTPFNEDELFAAIRQVTGAHPGDNATPGAIRAYLFGLPALRLHRTETGAIEYLRTETWPDLGGRGIGGEAHKEQVAEMARAEREQFEQSDRLAQENSPPKRERNELVALMRETALEVYREEIAELLGSPDKPGNVSELREWLTNRTRTAA